MVEAEHLHHGTSWASPRTKRGWDHDGHNARFVTRTVSWVRWGLGAVGRHEARRRHFVIGWEGGVGRAAGREEVEFFDF